MTLAWNSKSIDPTAARSDLLVVLLEGIHASAVEALRHAGYTRIVTHAKSLAGIKGAPPKGRSPAKAPASAGATA